MRSIFVVITVLLLLGCSAKHYIVNGVICPSNHTEQQVQDNLNACRYYDEKAIAEASKSPIKPECIECLKKHGYALEK
ncbi:MAG TPA: hypothetical protein ENK65_02600 [Helicobacteraceae bacterium]|nr:hypothetical protein [Helicobacteraceae bacterium]